MPFLRQKNGPNKGQKVEIKDQPLSMGRDPNCGIEILDKGASRLHAEVFRIGEMCFIRDLDSRNGTFVNDAKIEEELLREGDRIQIGATVLVFEGGDGTDLDVEFSEESVGNTLELRLEDLTSLNVGEGDGSEARRLRSFYRLSRVLTEVREEQELIDKVLPFVCAETNADTAYLFARDSEKGNFTPVGTYSRSDAKTGKVSRTIIRRAVQEKRALMTSDATQDNRFSARDSIVLKQIHSVICVPFSVSGELSGVLYLASDTPADVFTEDELELAAAMSDQIGVSISNLRVRQEQREQLMSTIRVLVRASEMRDPTSAGHSERVAAYSLAIGRELKLRRDRLENLQLAAFLHEIGKLALGGDSLYGVGRPHDGEAKPETEAQKIVGATLEIVKDMRCFSVVEEAIRYQLEHHDGSGPEAMVGEKIPLAARIIAVADYFDRKANAVREGARDTLLKEAVVDLNRQAGKLFDENVVKALLIAHRKKTLHASLDEQVAAVRSETEE